jgi:hypothetical protein
VDSFICPHSRFRIPTRIVMGKRKSDNCVEGKWVAWTKAHALLKVGDRRI